MPLQELYKLRLYESLMQNSLWHHDCHPELPDLEPRRTLTIGSFTGPGIVRTIHLTLNIAGDEREELLRGVFLAVTYDRNPFPSVYAPVGDFFCDSFAGESLCFASAVMAKRPTHSLFCYLPMPFQQEVLVQLLNRTDKKVTGYGYVTAERLPAWEAANACLQAQWRAVTVRLSQETVPLLHTEGRGHFLGCHLTAASACPYFAGNQGICEGNVEFFIDGSAQPVCNYLGTEDFFGFSWNWRKLWYDDRAGTTYLRDEDGVTKLACYRFLLDDPVRFARSLQARINYEYELKNLPLQQAKSTGNGVVQFGIVTYWYQASACDARAGEVVH